MGDFNIQDNLCEFIKEFGNDFGSLELLIFFGRHPHTRFSRKAIIHAADIKRIDLARALRCLIDKHLVITFSENSVTLYALTRDVALRSLVLGLLDINQHQWQLLAERIIQAYETA